GVVEALTARDRRPFERILADVDDRRHVGRGLLARPPVRLLEELELEVVMAERAEMRASEVEDLVPRRRSLALQYCRLIVAVEMVLIGPAVRVHALEQLPRDVGIAGRSRERRQPVEPREDAVLHRAGLDHAGPANDGRHSEAALIAGALG